MYTLLREVYITLGMVGFLKFVGTRKLTGLLLCFSNTMVNLYLGFPCVAGWPGSTS